MTIVGAQHTGLHVADLERSLVFYRDLLGLELVWQRSVTENYVQTIVGVPGAELRQAMLRIPGTDHHIELIDYRNVERQTAVAGPPHIGTAHVCLIVKRLRELHRRLVAEGVPSVSDPVVVPVGPNKGRVAVYMVDPDGFRVELLQIEPTEAM